MLGAILIIVAMALVFPPLVFGAGMVLSGLFGWLFGPFTEPRVDTGAGADTPPAERAGSPV